MFFEEFSAVKVLPQPLQDLIGKYPECKLLSPFPVKLPLQQTNRISPINRV